MKEKVSTVAKPSALEFGTQSAATAVMGVWEGVDGDGVGGVLVVGPWGESSEQADNESTSAASSAAAVFRCVTIVPSLEGEWE